MTEARPSSRNADMQTEHNEEFPSLFEERTRKQARTYGKKRFTLLVKRIENHMNEGNSRTELKFLRKELANQLEECTRAHNIYCSSKDLTETPSEAWIIQLQNITATMYGRIDEYIRTINRPPSAIFSNPGSNTRTIHSQHSKLNLLDVQSQINEESASASISQISTSVSSTAQTVELRQRLDSEKLAREELEKKFQQLQTDIAEKHQRENDENISAVMLSEEIKTLRSSINQYQLAHDQEMKQRRDHEQSFRADLDEQRNELEMEKLARRTDKPQYEREKEGELEKLRLSFDERLARDTFLHNWQSIKHAERTQDHLGARPKQHQQFTANDSEPKVPSFR
ncbi:hypothetical protein GHT06_014476 [Daphnia sinensis]|uniref:Uncharacterized protein n=1 Tax=Daphnia sinensis TaxID=1820382 RepID=A0AAD5LD12_9CRUS|nr:hypothetical protein GHT06_014476 [Daphnia sinensis]